VNQKALYAVLLTILLPLSAYFIVKSKSQHAIVMPRHYLPDTVMEVVRKGKRVNDTVWHRVADFALSNQEGKPVSWNSLKGKIVVADFFFTRCPTICPGLTRNMKRMAEGIHNGKRVGDRMNNKIHFLSFSIDPDRDSVQSLKQWADRFQVNPENWWLLTGNKQEIYNLIINEMKVMAEDGHGVDTSFIHTDHFVLLDSNRYVRGYYHGLDSVSLAKLSEDMLLLTMEKGKKSKSFFAGKLELIAVVFLAAILGVVLLVYFFKKNS